MKLEWAHTPAHTVIVRTPLFPFDTLIAWAAAADPRVELRRLLDDPVIREALIVSSPELDAGLGAWLANPEDPELRRVEHSLARYLARMAGRPTPFGLMSSIGTGSLGATSSLAIEGRDAAYRRARIDGDYLTATCTALSALPEVRAGLRYTPSTSLYEAGGRLRYAEARTGNVRSYHLVDVEPSDYLVALLERARNGATVAELVETLCLDPDVGTDDAEAFVNQLIDAQLLVSDLEPTVTGREPAVVVIERLRSFPAGEAYAAPLEQLAARLRAYEALPLGAPTTLYRGLATGLEAIPVAARLDRLVQIDLHKDTSLVVGKDIVDEVTRALALVHAIGGAGEDDPLGRFRNQFSARYSNREVPLVEVLDEESGLGFLQNPPPTAPLLDLEFPQRTDKKMAPWNRRDIHLLHLAQTAVRTGSLEVELTAADEVELAREHPARLYSVLLVPIAIGAGRIRLMNVDAPGVRMLGRFCHGSPAIAQLVRELIQREEAERPEAIFAEVVHLPEGRIGNVLFRPQLRGYEIPFLGRSGAPPEVQLPISDLTVSVVGSRVVIRSRREGKEIIPRLTTAHMFTRYTLAVYRFLAGVAGQDGTFVGWSWGVLADAPFTPRVRTGSVILARARWKLGAAELAKVKAAKHAAIAALRTELRWPRWIALVESDNELPVDLDNALAVDSFIKLIAGQVSAQLVEVFPAPDDVAVRGPDGGYAHEIQLLYVRDQPAAPIIATPAVDETRIERVFSPGSSWLFLKYYCGFAMVDTVLREVAPIARELVASGVATHWFFIRYNDPDWHLRFRLSGAPADLLGRALPLLEERLRPLVRAGVIWKTQLETYEREIERYGGEVGIGPSEELFAADSEAAATIIEAFQADEGVRLMWRAALLGIDRLLDDLGLDFATKRALVTTMRDEFGSEIGMDTEFQRRLGEKFRKHRTEIEAALVALPEDELAPARVAFDRRSAALRDIVPRLRGAALPIEKLAASYTHMQVNRMTAAAPRQQELVLYDLLRRHYEGVAARSKAKR